MLLVLFLVLLLVVIGIILGGINIVTHKALAEPRPLLFRSMLILVAWMAYVLTLCFSGIFTNFSLPPRIPMFLVLPFLLFLIYFLTNSKFKPLIDAVPLHWPVYFQSFRLGVELLIYYAFIKDIFPRIVTFEGYNFDILAGLTAPIIGYFVSKKINGSKTILVIWNIIGLLLLLNVVIIFNTCIYLPKLWDSSTPMIKPAYGMLPLALLAGIFMPAAVFMHLLSLSTVLRMKKANQP